MTLVVAFIGKNGAVMAGDMREITFEGEKSDREKLEKELYSGNIVTDDELMQKAKEFGVRIKVTDNKNKISEKARGPDRRSIFHRSWDHQKKKIICLGRKLCNCRTHGCTNKVNLPCKREHFYCFWQ